MDRTEGTQRLFEHFARIGRAVVERATHPPARDPRAGRAKRRRINHRAQLPVANTSHHLQVLRRARLVDVRRQGTRIYYRLAGLEVFGSRPPLRRGRRPGWWKSMTSMRTFFSNPEQMEPVSREELVERVREEAVLVLDVRGRRVRLGTSAAPTRCRSRNRAAAGEAAEARKS